MTPATEMFVPSAASVSCASAGRVAASTNASRRKSVLMLSQKGKQPPPLSHCEHDI
jgi:hypothetical protein